MEIFGTFTKRMKKGKNPNGIQRWELKKYIIHSCKRCGKQTTSRLKNEDFHPFCRSCTRIPKQGKEDSFLYTHLLEQKYSQQYIVEQKEFAIREDFIEMTCKEHGIKKKSRIGDLLHSFKKYDKDVVVGPCPECQRLSRRIFTCKEGDENKEYKLYYIYIPKIQMYKLGITSQEKLTKRTYGKPFDLIWEKSFPYDFARKLENSLHTYYKDKRYVGKEKLLKDGNTELYTENIIPSTEYLSNLILSSDFKEKSLI